MTKIGGRNAVCRVGLLEINGILIKHSPKEQQH